MNECATVKDVCKNCKCVDTIGSYKCIAPPGFHFDAEKFVHMIKTLNINDNSRSKMKRDRSMDGPTDGLTNGPTDGRCVHV